MNYDNIRQQLFENGVVHVNTNTEKADFDTISSILDKFTKTLIVGKHHIEGDKRLQIVSEKEMFGGEYLDWHTDQSYNVKRYHGTLLAFNSADHETYTEFADMRKAYNALSDEEKSYYSNIVCTYGVPPKMDNLMSAAQIRLMRDTANKPILEGNTWPIINKHPVTKETSLYFSPLTFYKSNKIFDKQKLIQHCEKFTFKHFWKPGDIVLWDNRLVMHRRPAFNGHRELFRVCFDYE